ncbi:MAG TPA: efflux RND transporter periplasmic adaptor subunit [Chloroflexota bacterium]|nr:efflux RND transporter periplasmic adaptor subunit [Chloroflexota bacterium]
MTVRDPATPVAARVAAAPAAADGPAAGALPARAARARRRWLQWVLGAAVVLVVVGWAAVARPGAPATPTPTPSAPSALSAHGVVQPIARASVATMGGGVVDQLPARVGEVVEAKQVLARVTLGGQVELLVAPWRGTVTGVGAHLGDTVMPGTAIATIADLSRYQVETTDVDEYLIAQLRPGQAVAMTVDAVDGLQLRGTVRTVGLQPQSAAGAASYPVVVDLAGADTRLRPGMTAKLRFEGER